MSDKTTCFNNKNEDPVEGGRGTANLVQKCKLYRITSFIIVAVGLVM